MDKKVKLYNSYGKQKKNKMQTKPYGIEDRKIKTEKLLSREDSETLRKEKGIGLYASPPKKKAGIGLYASPPKSLGSAKSMLSKVKVEKRKIFSKYKDTKSILNKSENTIKKIIKKNQYD